MRLIACLLVVSLLAGCDALDRVTMTSEERINAALPPRDTEDARARLLALLAEFKQPAGPMESQWNDQLRARALHCSAGYKPSLLDSSDDIRASLTNQACFEEADKELLSWLHWRTAGLLLAAPPLRPLPPELPAAIGAKGYILNARFADAAGIAVLHTSEQLALVDLTTGETLAAHAISGFPQQVGHLSPNGRLLAVGTINSTRLVDTVSGEMLLNLVTSEAFDLRWLDDRTAITGEKSGQGSMLLDFDAGRTVPINWMYRSVTNAMAIPGQAGTFTLVYSGGVSRMKLEREGGDVRATSLGELPIEGDNNLYQGSFTGDGRYFIYTIPDLHEVDVERLALVRRSLYPLRPGLVEIPGPGPNEMLIGPSTPDRQSLDLVYRPEDQTVRVVHGVNTQRGNLVYVNSLKTLARKEKNRLVRIDTMETEEPMSLIELSALVLEGKWGTVLAENEQYQRQFGVGAPAATTRPGVAPSKTWVEAIGVYQGSVHGSIADILVEVRLSPKPERALVLSSYEAVRWRIYGPGVSSLKAIYLSGYKQSTVIGTPSSIPIKVIGRQYAYQRDDATYRNLEGAVSTELGKGIDSFQGTYEGRSFIVGP